MTEPASKTSIPRLHSVTFKNGGAKLRVLRTPHQDNRKDVEGRIRTIIENHMAESTEIGGFAFVVWDKEGGSTADSANFCSGIPRILILDFVRSRLLALTIEGWVYEGMS